MMRILIGAAAGILLGALLGYAGKCRSGTCPLTSSPLWGAIFLGLMGAFIGWAIARGQTHPESQASHDIRSVVETKDFDQAIGQQARPVLVDFYATWCGPCRQLAPIIGKLSQTYAGKVDFIKIDVDQARDLARKYNVESIPRVMLFNGGTAIGEPLVGLQDESAYVAAIEEAIGLSLKGRRAQNLPPEKALAPITQEGKTMTTQTMRSVTMKGNPLTLGGNEVKVGDKAPDFVAVDNGLKAVKFSDLCKGKVCIIASVPSLDTPVCSIETRRFNQDASSLGDNVRIVTVSMDLPFAQKRWCAAEGIKNVITVSDYRDRAFGQAYGVTLGELGLLARAVFVVDAGGKIVYEQIVPEIASEPDYDSALKAAMLAAGK